MLPRSRAGPFVVPTPRWCSCHQRRRTHRGRTRRPVERRRCRHVVCRGRASTRSWSRRSRLPCRRPHRAARRAGRSDRDSGWPPGRSVPTNPSPPRPQQRHRLLRSRSPTSVPVPRRHATRRRPGKAISDPANDHPERGGSCVGSLHSRRLAVSPPRRSRSPPGRRDALRPQPPPPASRSPPPSGSPLRTRHPHRSCR